MFNKTKIRPEIITEIKKLNNANLTEEQLSNMQNYIYSLDYFPRDIMQIAKLPDSANYLRFEEKAIIINLLEEKLRELYRYEDEIIANYY